MNAFISATDFSIRYLIASYRARKLFSLTVVDDASEMTGGEISASFRGI